MPALWSQPKGWVTWTSSCLQTNRSSKSLPTLRQSFWSELTLPWLLGRWVPHSGRKKLTLPLDTLESECYLRKDLSPP
jgi:hypothetical protein